ncbi:16S rRNA (guanine(527)-N(7))-methyltransferase RsmG [Candidatus Latescibacterota bacterium]
MIPLPLFASTVREGARYYGVELDDHMLDLLVRYYEILIEWSVKVNLVSKRDLDRFAEYHVLDAMKTASCYDLSSVNRMLDFGSGAGLPGVPLAIAYPQIETLLVESRKKRCAFLSEVCSRINELNVSAVQSRAETLDDSHDRKYNIVISRATLNLSTLYMKSKRFLSDSGSIISIKGEDIDDELESLYTVVDKSLFNIDIRVPKQFGAVRSGKLVVITRH